MENFDYRPKKPESEEDKKIVIEHGVEDDGEVYGVESWELKNWKELYPKLNVGKTLEKVADLMEYIYENHPGIRRGNAEDEDGEWDGTLLLWGFKREIMNLLDPNREDNTYFKGLPEDVQNKIREIKLEDCIKE